MTHVPTLVLKSTQTEWSPQLPRRLMMDSIVGSYNMVLFPELTSKAGLGKQVY